MWFIVSACSVYLMLAETSNDRRVFEAAARETAPLYALALVLRFAHVRIGK